MYVGNLLSAGVRDIEVRCDQLINGVEGGLSNIKSRFREEALAEVGKKLTEETLTSWLLAKRLQAAGFVTDVERPYPDSNEECDLVLYTGDERRFWVEVKYAWKRWFRCEGVDKANPVFKAYLLGDASHPGAAHDFRKLARLRRPDAERVGVLLIGLDSTAKPMDPEIALLAEQEKLAAHRWELVVETHWRDRRDSSFRLNSWFWSRATPKCGALGSALEI